MFALLWKDNLLVAVLPPMAKLSQVSVAQTLHLGYILHLNRLELQGSYIMQ